ncbi:MAG: serine/threonine-protein kinase [Nannocystaceae bacterium]|nr:serine/threonine-protein kinase [Nannocystaceae bacterium]
MPAASLAAPDDLRTLALPTSEGATVPSTGDEVLAGAEPELPRRVGRYVVLEHIGQGGMGVVVGAWDAQLDRAVAIKLLHPRARGLNAGPRLQREAQALARLSHAHVVPVYDVGLHEGRCFVAMEWVRGCTLSQWLRRAPRSSDEVLAMFLGAAAGLAAAHGAGIVHRDFKPDNVLVGDDGRARVVDFGLAVGHGDDSDVSTRAVAVPGASAFESKLTATGIVVGTPAYMAPEQLRGSAADARSDQYSFCVALHEALLGERPRYDSRDTSRSLPAARTGEGASSRASARLRRVLARGLSLVPARRWPSMDALIAELRAAAARPRRLRAHAAALLAGAVTIGVVAGSGGHRVDADDCTRRVATARARWDDSAHDRVREAIAATGRGYAEQTWTLVADALDREVARTGDEHQRQCEAARVEPVPAAMVACVEQREAAIAAVIDVLAQTDASSLERAPLVVAGLPPLEPCLDAARASQLPAVPTEPQQRDAVATAREALTTVRALRDARRFDEGVAQAKALQLRALEIDFGPLGAEVDVELGSLLELLGEHDEAERTLATAETNAVAFGQDRTAAAAATRLVGLVGYHRARTEDGAAWARHAESLMARFDPTPRERALLANQIGAMHFRAGDYTRAATTYEGVVATLAGTTDASERQELANAYNNLGNVRARQGRIADAAVALERAVAVMIEQLGPEHPTVATVLVNLGNVEYDLGHFEAADTYHRRARELLERSVGREHPLYAAALTNHGLALHRLGRTDEGIASLQQSIELKLARLGPDHPDLAFSLSNLGELERERGHVETALTLHRRALAIWDRVDGRHPYAAYPITNVALDLLALDRLDEAEPLLRRATIMAGDGVADASIAAATHFGMAQLLSRRPRTAQHAEAVALAARASARYHALGGRYALEAGRIDDWLVAQAGGDQRQTTQPAASVQPSSPSSR